MMKIRSIVAIVVLLVCSHGASGQGLAPDYDFDWVTIGNVGNAPYVGGPYGQLAGRGGVDYEYRISRFEITSGQWLEFLNTYAAMGDPYGFRFTHSDSIVQNFGYPGPGTAFIIHPDIPDGANVPVIGISWRNVARYANWLHNDKTPTLEALAGGAYDTSTWGMSPTPVMHYTDAATHEPGAKFWIPTVDEWLKAAHHDPNRFGTGQGGWWDYPNGTDTPLHSGPPGLGQSNAGYVAGPDEWPEYLIPLGSYPAVQSPWGLYDVSGGASEWAEDWLFPDSPYNHYRMQMGSVAGEYMFPGADIDLIFRHTSSFPNIFNGDTSVRLASPVPITAPLCVGDIMPPAGDGVVGIADIVVLLDAFGPCPPAGADCLADITPIGGNGTVNIDDLVSLLNSFGPCP